MTVPYENYNALNVMTGVATVWYAPFGLTTPGQPEPAPADPGAPRTDTATVTSGSPTVSDTSITTADKGQAVTGTGIPANTYVGTVVAGTSFTLVDASGASVNATGAGTSVQIAVGVAGGAKWGGNWVAVGATDQGVTLSTDNTQNKITIEEQLTPALVTTDAVNVTFTFSLAEDELDNLALAAGLGSIATQAAGASNIGKKTFTFGKVLNPYTIGFEALNHYGFFRRGYVPLMLSGGGKVDTAYRRAKEKRMYPVTLTAICDPSEIYFWDQTADHT